MVTFASEWAGAEILYQMGQGGLMASELAFRTRGGRSS